MNENSERQLLALYRRRYGSFISTLTRYLGIPHLKLAERVVEDAFLKTVERWGRYVPPGGARRDPIMEIWSTLNSLTIQILSGEGYARYQKYEAMIEKDGEWSAPTFFVLEEQKDDMLRMLFACTHPELEEEDREILVAAVLCGMSAAEIKAAFTERGTNPSERVKRAKDALIAVNPPYKIPQGWNSLVRLDEALRVLHRIFTEGGNRGQWRRGWEWILIELVTLIGARSGFDTPKAHALCAFMLLSAGMTPSSRKSGIDQTPPSEEERALWDKRLISKGLEHLHHSARGTEVTIYHLEAGISACHAISESVEATDWKKLVSLYDSYLNINDSTEVQFNRSIALARLKGAREGVDDLVELVEKGGSGDLKLLHSSLGDLYMKLGKFKEALHNYGVALDSTRSKADRKRIEKRIDGCLRKIDMTSRYPAGSTF